MAVMIGDDSTRWYVVQTQPNREVGASQQLGQQGFKSFFPRHLKTRRHARRIETIMAPYFPGYIFVSLDLTRDRWRSVNGTYGVARLVAFGEKPDPVPRGIVEALLDFVDQRGLMCLQQTLAIGQSVRILAGPFADMLGKLARLDADGRVRVLLDMMGGNVPMSLPREFVSG